MREIKKMKKKYLKEGDIFSKNRRGWRWIEWEIIDKEGHHRCSGIFPRVWSKYWSRIKYLHHILKPRNRNKLFSKCMCYWCLRDQYKTRIKCPKCKKRELKSMDYHRNNLHKPHESGTIVYCKCGYKKDLNEEFNKILNAYREVVEK